MGCGNRLNARKGRFGRLLEKRLDIHIRSAGLCRSATTETRRKRSERDLDYEVLENDSKNNSLYALYADIGRAYLEDGVLSDISPHDIKDCSRYERVFYDERI